MYVIETIRHASGNGATACLHDWTKAEVQGWDRDHADDDYRTLRRVPADAAHHWVRIGRLHTTALYRDGNRIRRAASGW